MTPLPGSALPQATIAVLLATFNGERFLHDQLHSLACQNVSRVDLYASDDGSTDATVAILKQWQRRWTKGHFEIFEGPRNGFSENFRSLALRDLHAFDYLSFSDQDDVWDRDKLSAAVTVLSRQQDDRPAVYFSRTRLIDENGQDLGMSPLFSRPLSFGNAIIQSIGGGNTMVHNRPAAQLFIESCRRTSFFYHDWWSYILIAGAGGYVYYSPNPHIAYRQHERNIIGHNRGFTAKIARIRRLMNGSLVRWTDEHLSALYRCSDLLTPDNLASIEKLELARRGFFLLAPFRIFGAGLYRQTAAGNIALVLAALTKRL